jgi:hypothetical protein
MQTNPIDANLRGRVGDIEKFLNKLSFLGMFQN